MTAPAAKPKPKPKLGASPPAPNRMRPIPLACDLPVGLDPLLDRAQVQAALRCSRRALSRFVASGEFPQPSMRLGAKRSARWRASVVNDWISGKCEDSQPEEST